MVEDIKWCRCFHCNQGMSGEEILEQLEVDTRATGRKGESDE